MEEVVREGVTVVTGGGVQQHMTSHFSNFFIHMKPKIESDSFTHYGDVYSAPSRLLLRSAPDPFTAKEKSFEARVKCVRISERILGSDLCDKGSPFHTEGPTTENAHAWVVDV